VPVAVAATVLTGVLVVRLVDDDADASVLSMG
jgi:hypothetical protein